MNSKEICEILEASKGSSVQEIKTKDITIKFRDLTNCFQGLNNSTNVIPYVEDIQVSGDSQDPERNTDNKELVDEFTMAQLMASDPEAFEKNLRG